MREGVDGQFRSVMRGGRESSEGAGKIIRVDGVRGSEWLVSELHGEERSAGDGGSTALAKETGFGDAAVFDARFEMKDIAADWIGDFHVGSGTGELADVARGLKMVEDGGGEHVLSIPRGIGLGNVDWASR